MRIKKFFSCSLAVVLTFLTVITGFFNVRTVHAEEIDYSRIFQMSLLGDQYRISGFAENYQDYLKTLSTTELVYPEEYGEPSKKVIGNAVFEQNLDDMILYENYLTSIKFNSSYTFVPKAGLGLFNKLKKVEFTSPTLELGESIAYDKDFYDMLVEFEMTDEMDYAKIEEIHIDAGTVTVHQNAFNKINSTVRIIVSSQAVKDAIVNATKDGSAPVAADQITVNDTRQPSEIRLELENAEIYYGTEGGFKPKATVVTGDQTEENITYQLYTDENCETEYKGQGYQQNNIAVGTYYMKATMTQTANYHGAESNIVKVQVLENKPTDKTALNAAIAAAEKFQEENQYNQQNFDQTAWKNVFYSGGSLDKAKEISADTENRYSQEKVDEAAKNLNDSLDALKKSVADNTEAWNKLQDLIKKAEGIVANDKDKYTEESWTKANLQAEIDEAKALKKDDATTTVMEIERHISVIQSSIDGLKLKDKEPDVKPGEPFAFIKKGSQVKVLAMTASEKLVGATKVRVTFRCAEDVSFNTNASIDIDPVIAGTSNYLQIKGTGDYTTGATYTVEVPLSAAIKAGDSIEIIMTTFSWDDAKDYAYGVTAIEFVDANDKVLGSYIDADVYKENLATAIKEAEAINTSTYTAESVEKLTKALEAAKALKEDATAEEMRKAIDAINDAIKGLTKKDEEEEAREKLAAKIKEAEAIDTSLYTPESVEKLTKALEAAKALKEDASEEEINKVLAAIDEAIKGLVKKGGTGNDTPQTPKPITKVIGVAKGKTFAAGNFVYKVSAAATITGTVKKAGKVTVTGLSKTGKKKSSINVKNAVSASGASYQVTGIGSKAFRKAAKLKKVTLGTSVKSIPTSAFENCKKLTSVKATGVTKIGAKAFKGCKVLAKLTFGKKKVSSVKKGAFKGCKKTIKVAGGSKKVKKGNVKKLKKSGYKKFK